MAKLSGKVAIVTGGSSGIGKAISLAYAKEGAKVVVAARNAERSQAVVDEIKKNGGDALFVKTDVLVESDIKALVEKTVAQYGQIDILVNNAGMQVLKPLPDVSSEDWDHVMNGNAKAVFFTIQQAMPYLLKTKGVIVTTASMASIKPVDLHYAYAASKAAVAMLTKVVAKDYAPHGVRANSICPGLVQTPLLGSATPEVIDSLTKEIPMKRIGQPEDIASVAVFLASDDSSWMTGQNLCVDGGATLL